MEPSTEAISGLRIIGLAVGSLGLLFNVIFYRGPRWKKKNFVLSGLLSLGLIAVCLNPNLLNTLATTLRLEEGERGRILTLLIGSNILLWYLLVYLKGKLDRTSHQFDQLIRHLGYDEVQSDLERELSGKTIVVIIPAYNEEENLKKLLPEIPAQIHGHSVGVLVVDDGSTDKTVQVVKEAGRGVVRNRINRGQGAASRLGYDVLVKYDIPIGVTMDADNQHLPEDLAKLVEPITRGAYDLIIGSRILSSYSGSLLRKTGVVLLTKMINLLADQNLRDCSSGLKAFKVERLKRLNLREDQFQSAEVILEAAKKGLKIGEVPITIQERTFGASKKGPDWRYGFDFSKVLFKSWWR